MEKANEVLEMKELLFEISYNCNLKCIHCSSINCQGKLKIRDIPNLADIGVVRISGGEPTLNKDLINYIKFFKDKKIKVILQTNGQNELTNDILNNIDEIWLSLYGNQEIHDFITMTNGSFCKSIKFIENYHKIKSIEIQTPIFNLFQTFEAIKIAKYYYGLKIRLSALVNQGRCNFALSTAEQIKIANELIDIYYGKIKLPCSLSNEICEFDDKLVMKPDGSIFNCASHKQGKKLCKR